MFYGTFIKVQYCLSFFYPCLVCSYCIAVECKITATSKMFIFLGWKYYNYYYYSAGVGRTGTFIALDALFSYGKIHGEIDICEYVKIMRGKRMNMIQTKVKIIILFNIFSRFIFVIGCRALEKYGFRKSGILFLVFSYN